MKRNKITQSVVQILLSFIFGFLFIVFLLLIIGGGFFIGRINSDVSNTQEKLNISEAQVPLQTYHGKTFSLDFPKNYQLNINKIVATEGIVVDQVNTIQLISPILPNSNGNLSIIFAYKPLKEVDEENNQSSTCPELNNKKFEVIKVGNNTFTSSGLIYCGPNQAAFFYVLNNGNVYEAKVETTADYEKDTLPEVLKILGTLKFSN